MADAALLPPPAAPIPAPAAPATLAAPVRHRLVLCADDYGLTAGVSLGILQLLGLGRLSAVGVMANMPAWPGWAAALGAGRGDAAIGLHLNLTTGAPLGAMPWLAPGGRLPPLGTLLARLLARPAQAGAEVAAEIDRQLDAFRAGFGAAPEFIDGHQHVHVLPVVRGALLRRLLARRRPGAPPPWLRDPAEAPAAILRRRLSADKALVVAALAAGFGRAARAAGFATNQGFSGFSPLRPDTPAPLVMHRALLGLGPRPLVMCHPGHADAALRALDPAVESRPAELAWLASHGFGLLLDQERITLVPHP